jgi:predicted GIY-YIG superfamily endonuclease
MKGFIYLTKEFNSDGQELKHNNLTKIGIGKTNDLNRRFYEHHNKGSKSTTEVDFIKTFEVEDMDSGEKELHRTLKSLGYEVVTRTSLFDENKLESKTEVFSGKRIDTSEEISEKIIIQILESIVTGSEYIKITRREFKPHFLQEIAILQCLDAIDNADSDSVNIIAELCARFGKTLTYLELFRRLENDIMILPSYMHSVFTSFENEIIGKYKDEKIGKWSNFQNFKVIDTRENNNWQEKLKENLGKSKLVVFVSIQTPEESFSKFDSIKEIDSKRKFVVIDEADFGAHTKNSQKVIDYII